MSAVSIFRAVVFVRGCWCVLDWIVGEASYRHVATCRSLHAYVELFGDTTAVAMLLAILAGLWFFHRWARLLFVLLLGLVLVYSAVQPHHSVSRSCSFVLAVTSFMVMLNGAIVAMSFLSPVRDMFARQI